MKAEILKFNINQDIELEDIKMSFKLREDITNIAKKFNNKN